MQDKELQLEDTVSADRKEHIIYVGPGKTRKISSITSRQNFNNEKFTRKANKGEDEEDEQEKVEESAIQNIGTSQIETGAPTQSDLINQDKKKKSNSPQIEFVTGTEKAASSSTAIGNAQNMGIKKISEAIVKKALTKIKADRNTGVDEAPFDGPYTKSPDTVVDKSGAKHTPMSRVRHLARQAMNKNVKEEVEQIDELSVGAIKNYIKKAKQNKKFEADTQATAIRKNDHMMASDSAHIIAKRKEGIKTAKAKLNKEGTEMKTYQEFLDQLLEYTPGPGGITRVQGRSYGAQYHDPEGDDDADDKPAAKADTPKRGRGRPAGSKSGANQKVTTGKSYGGIATHSLHLPNSK